MGSRHALGISWVGMLTQSGFGGSETMLCMPKQSKNGDHPVDGCPVLTHRTNGADARIKQSAMRTSPRTRMINPCFFIVLSSCPNVLLPLSGFLGVVVLMSPKILNITPESS